MQTKAHSLARFLYNHNPFYLLSACLVLYGLHLAFAERADIPETAWLLATSLCGYTLLLALTAYLVVRLGRVWEDARSIALLVILMFVAISVSFDEICNTLPATASLVLTFGLIFSLLVSEGLIRSLEIKFPVSYRVPLYLTLGLFFLYPLWVSPNLSEQTDIVTAWRVFSFPSAAGVVMLTLLPAIRRGSALMRKNGTPWQWPWYPWPVFVFLAVGICFRSYVLTLSFQAAHGLETSFSTYYLTPFLFAILVLLSEIGFVESSRRLQRFVLASSPILLLVSVPFGHGQPFHSFLGSVVEHVGSPLWLALLGGAVFYAYLWARGLKEAEFACMTMLLLLVNVGPRTVDFDSVALPQGWPLVALAAIQAVQTFLLKSSLRFVITSCSLLAAMSCSMSTSWFTSHTGVIPLHLAVGLSMLAGFLFTDRFAQLIRWSSPFAMILPAMIVAVGGDRIGASETHRVIYVSVLCGISLGFWLATRERGWQLALLANTASTAIALSIWLHTGVQHVIPPRALAALGGGIVCFLVAALISALKGGFSKQLRHWIDDVWRPFPPNFEEDQSL
ncbi:MAG: hypothetical protein H6822_21755 [Planctomycetaceae bacterium]|nr:hypothetical protein [Planctomycetales bacterium]MCB9924822.1 hypothetical protein [Planctomycetaceae bacterium]